MRRSVIVSLATAMLLIPGALGTPGAASSAGAAPDGHPEGRTLYPARLQRGPDTGLLHLEENTIVDRGVRTRLRGIPHKWILGRIGRGYLLETADADFSRYAVLLVRHDGSTRVLQRFGQRTTPVPSADGERLVLATLRQPDTRIRVVRTRSGELVRSRTFRSYGVEVVDYGRRRMVLTGLPGGRAAWWDPATDRLSRIVARPVWSADISANRLVYSVPHPTVEFTECQKTVELRRPSVVLWQSCDDRPLAFSPDGSRMLTTYLLADGIGPGLLQLRRADGELLRTYRPPGYFGFVQWESNRRILVQPVGKMYVAAVRCDLADRCERASRLYRSAGDLEPPRSMRWSFP